MGDGRERRSDSAARRVEIPGRTFAKAAVAVLFTLVAIWLVRELAVVLLLIALALLLAAILSGVVAPLQRWGLGRGIASLIALVAVVAVVGGVLALVLPPLITQTAALIDNLPDVVARVQRVLAGHPTIFKAIQGQAAAVQRDPSGLVSGILQFGVSVVGLVAASAVILTLALYFLLDGDHVMSALLRLTPLAYRYRVQRTIAEAGRVIRAYFIGQVIISAIFATYTFIVLSVLDVPYPAVLAALAFLLDAIPNIGATLATVLPALVALPESVTTALIAVAAMLVYQQLENNLISPRILGGRLQVPPIATFLMVLVGGRLLGVVGVFVAIPLAGMLPVLERIWIQGAPADRGGAGASEPTGAMEEPVERPGTGEEEAA